MSDVLYTIGHSNHAMEHFLTLLQQHGVKAVADVRSQPYSSYLPQFSQAELKRSLKMAGIAYVFLGKELGARSDNKKCYLQGKVQYDLLAQEPLFVEGLDRVQRGMQTHTIALMCAEKDPLECHRAILVARHLYERGISVSHILASGDLITHAELEKNMLTMLKLAECNLLESREEVLQRAYILQGGRIAYQADSGSSALTEQGMHP
ncbi:MAG: DUF488 domain-containing protein [Magnetococcus sp. YQC-5]